jgi:autophagy-related protein 9
MGRRSHKGYMLANQSVMEEDERDEDEDVDLEAGNAKEKALDGSNSGSRIHKSVASGSGRKVSWNQGTSQTSPLRPNIHQEDKIHEEDSDEEVPQSFMIEATGGGHSKGKRRAGTKSPNAQKVALHSVAGRRLPPSRSPTPTQALSPPKNVSIPPKPSEIDIEDSPEQTPNLGVFTDALPTHTRQQGQLRGLDDYEKALWNWVNVYNLDGFLQEVYQYYEGNGIYSIALSRGLNLL